MQSGVTDGFYAKESISGAALSSVTPTSSSGSRASKCHGARGPGPAVKSLCVLEASADGSVTCWSFSTCVRYCFLRRRASSQFFFQSDVPLRGDKHSRPPGAAPTENPWRIPHPIFRQARELWSRPHPQMARWRDGRHSFSDVRRQGRPREAVRGCDCSEKSSPGARLCGHFDRVPLNMYSVCRLLPHVFSYGRHFAGVAALTAAANRHFLKHVSKPSWAGSLFRYFCVCRIQYQTAVEAVGLRDQTSPPHAPPGLTGGASISQSSVARNGRSFLVRTHG